MIRSFFRYNFRLLLFKLGRILETFFSLLTFLRSFLQYLILLDNDDLFYGFLSAGHHPKMALLVYLSDASLEAVEKVITSMCLVSTRGVMQLRCIVTERV